MNFSFKSAKLRFDQEALDLTPDKTSSTEALYVDFNSSGTQDKKRFQIFIHPKKEVLLTAFELRFSVALTPQTSVFLNGFLSGHRRRTQTLSDKLPDRGWLAGKRDAHQRAPFFSDTQPFQSWHFGLADFATTSLLLGSLNETTSFTNVAYDVQKQEIIIRKDINGLTLGHSFPLLDLLVATGNKKAVVADYFSTMEPAPVPPSPLCGWMAHSVEGNSAAAITEFLDQKMKENFPADFILIGPDYIKETGDWLFSNNQFPDGLPPVIGAIKATGIKAGMTIEPLLCSAESDVYQQHPDWILKDDHNNTISVNTESGTRYVLDAYDPGVQDYLQVFCYTVIAQWGIELLKFDYLSVAFAKARTTKTSAQAIHDFLKMLRSSCPNCLIWATDLPLAPGWKYVDYTSLTNNKIERWDTRFPLLYRDPDADTAMIQIKNILHTFPLTPYGTAGNLLSLVATRNLSEAQQHTILFVNSLFSNISALSDSPASLSPDAWSEWRLTETWKTAEIISVHFQSETTCIVDFKNKKSKKFRGLINLGKTEGAVEGVKLDAGETIVLVLRSEG